MPPEVEEGNFEYKVWGVCKASIPTVLLVKIATWQRTKIKEPHKPTSVAAYREWRMFLRHRVTLMCSQDIDDRSRVEDDGTIAGIYEEEVNDSLAVLEAMCTSIGATIQHVEQRRISRRPELFAAEAHVVLRRPCAEGKRRIIKVAFVGESDAGKSTLLGVLTTGEGRGQFSLDNGNGSVRMSMLRHRHELLSGHTSSLAVEFLPFDEATQAPIRLEHSSLEPIPLSQQRKLLGTARVAQLIDLPGEPRYQKVTLSALTSWTAPDWVCLVVPTSSYRIVEGEDGTLGKFSDGTLDNLKLILGLELPFFIVLSKVDLVEETGKLCRLHKDLLEVVVEMRKSLLGVDMPPYAVSLQQISSVSGRGLENFCSHLYRLRPRRNLQVMNCLMEATPDVQAIFCVEGVQLVPDVGIVLLGTVAYGSFEVKQGQREHSAFLAPYGSRDDHQGLIRVQVISAHRMRLPVHVIDTGEMVTLAIVAKETEGLRLDADRIAKGSILAIYTDPPPPPPPSFLFAGSVRADVVGKFTANQPPTISEPVKGTLYWLGNRWTVHLTTLTVFYGELKLRAEFKLTDELKAIVLPGTRLVFICPQFRLCGFTCASKQFL